MPKTQFEHNSSLTQQVWDVLKGEVESSALKKKWKGKKNKTRTQNSNDLNVDETPWSYLGKG